MQKGTPKVMFFGPKSTLGRPRVDLSSDFWGSGANRKASILHHTYFPFISKNTPSRHPRKTTFGRPCPNHIRIYTIFRSDSKTKLPFLDPPKIQFSAKKSPKGREFLKGRASGKRPCAERPSKTDFYQLFSIFGRFGTVFGWILHHFPRFFVGFASISRPHGHP